MPNSNELTDVETAAPGRSESPSITEKPFPADGDYGQLSWATRNGLTFESFKPRTQTDINNPFNRSMKTRHLHMIAIGGSIGAGLFVGSGKAFNTGGPGSVLIDFSIIGVMMFNVVYALGELAVMYPVSGGFYTYSTRFIDPSWGFAMGWNYVFQWAIILPLELVVSSLTVGYWGVDVHVAVWISMFIIIIVVINIFGTLGYAEEEFWSSMLKLITIVIFMFVGLICVLGGGPSNGIYNEYWGARTWYDPGAFKNGFKGFCAVFVTAAFAFSGTELVGLAAAESANPAKSLPGAVRQVFWRISLFYVLALLFVGLLVRSDDPRLIGSTAFIDVTASPFVIAAKDAGLIGLDSFINVVIMVSVVSIGNSGVYGGSRTLTALAEQGYAPKIFAYIDKSGRPLVSTITIILFGFIAYITVNANSVEVFDWLLALSGLAALFTWGSICVAHIRFRAAWKYHGRSEDDIPFKSVFGVTGSWIGVTLVVLVLIAQFYTSIAPPGKGGQLNDVQGFFKSYLALPVVSLFWICGYFWKRQGWLTLDQIDIDTGRRPVDWDTINKERDAHAKLPIWRRFLSHLI